MSYYDPIYYPYYSARRACGQLSIAEVQARIRSLAIEKQCSERLELEARLRRQQQYLCQRRLEEYQSELRAKQRLENVINEQVIVSHIDEQRYRMAREEEALHLSYLQRIDRLKRERELLEVNPLEDLANAKYKAYLHDDMLIDNYENGRRAQEYQQELLNKIASGKRKVKSKNQENVEEKKLKNEAKQTVDTSSKKKNGELESFKRSYIDELKDNKNCSFTNDAIAKNIQSQGNTKRYQQRSPLKNDKQDIKSNTLNIAMTRSGYQNSPKRIEKAYGFFNPKINKRKNAKNKSKSVNHNGFIRNTGNNSMRGDLNNNQINRIKNRLNVSMIVFRDSKMRNTKHEVTHLFNTYLNELKGRQEIKNKINTHPKILKKHAMVVSH